MIYAHWHVLVRLHCQVYELQFWISEEKVEKVSVRVTINTALLFRNSQTPAKERSKTCFRKISQRLLGPCLLDYLPMKVTSCCHSVWQGEKKRQSAFQGRLAVSEVWDTSFTLRESDLCAVYPWAWGHWAPRRECVKEAVNDWKKPSLGSRIQIHQEKNAFQMHSAHEDMIRMEKAVKSVWFLRGICLYILIASSFSFISSGTWLPNEHIDYLSQMHISQLQAIKPCKISTMSGPRSGF